MQPAINAGKMASQRRREGSNLLVRTHVRQFWKSPETFLKTSVLMNAAPKSPSHSSANVKIRFAIAAFALLAVGSARLPAAPGKGLSLVDSWPAAGATGVSPDAVLRLRFNRPPLLGQSGFVRIVDVSSRSVAASIDASARTATRSIGGFPDFATSPITVADDEAEIPLPGLAYGKTYEISIDSSAFSGAGGLPGSEGGPAPLRFSTRLAGPAAGQTRLTVAADGTGDFCTVQAAVDFVPAGNSTPTTIFIKKGYYPEILAFAEKNALTFLGEDRKRTVIAYANNARFNAAGGNPFASPHPDPSAQRDGGHVYHRGVFLGHHAGDLVIANLTIRNTTPQGGSQAEAIILNGTQTARAILWNVDLYSFQDTLQINGQAFVSGCFIEGDVDFMWGTGPCFFDHCECRSVRYGTYYTQVRNPPTHHGFVFSHCVFDGAPGVAGDFLSRIQPSRFPASEVVLLDCTLGPSVGPKGWKLDDSPDAPGVHFWEYASRDSAGGAIESGQRLSVSRTLREPGDALAIAHYGDPAYVLGQDWHPGIGAALAAELERLNVKSAAAPGR